MLTIRPIRKQDKPAAYKVLQESFGKPAVSPENFDYSGSIIFVADLDGQIVGTVSLTVTKTFSYIDDLGVLPAFRGQQIATKLMEAAIKVAADNSDEVYAVCASPYSAKICEKLGFDKDDYLRYTKRFIPDR